MVKRIFDKKHNRGAQAEVARRAKKDPALVWLVVNGRSTSAPILEKCVEVAQELIAQEEGDQNAA